MFKRSVGVLESFLVEASGHPLEHFSATSQSVHEYKFEKDEMVGDQQQQAPRRWRENSRNRSLSLSRGWRAFAMVLCSGPCRQAYLVRPVTLVVAQASADATVHGNRDPRFA